MVMEYLGGEVLPQRLEKGATPLDHALQIAVEITDALDKAHRQGGVDRDRPRRARGGPSTARSTARSWRSAASS